MIGYIGGANVGILVQAPRCTGADRFLERCSLSPLLSAISTGITLVSGMHVNAVSSRCYANLKTAEKRDEFFDLAIYFHIWPKVPPFPIF